MVSKISLCYSSCCEITALHGNIISDNDTLNVDETDSDYDPDNYASDNSNPPPDTPNNKSTYNDSTYDLDDYNAAIILNPARVDHHGPIAGVQTNHNKFSQQLRTLRSEN